jgi:hypothetical protein
MTFVLILIANIVLDVALLGGLAYVMSHAAKLTPHQPGVSGNTWRIRRPVRHQVHAYSRGERAPLRQLHPMAEKVA